MARDLPAPLPPGERTVGQLVAESIKLYGERFWRVLPLGLALALVDQVSFGLTTFGQALVLLLGALALSILARHLCSMDLDRRCGYPLDFRRTPMFNQMR